MEILEPGKDYSKLKVFDEIRQKHGIIVTTSGQTVYYNVYDLNTTKNVKIQSNFNSKTSFNSIFRPLKLRRFLKRYNIIFDLTDRIEMTRHIRHYVYRSVIENLNHSSTKFSAKEAIIAHS